MTSFGQLPCWTVGNIDEQATYVDDVSRMGMPELKGWKPARRRRPVQSQRQVQAPDTYFAYLMLKAQLLEKQISQAAFDAGCRRLYHMAQAERTAQRPA